MRPLETVVVGVDGSSLSAVALRWAADRLPPGGTLHVVHAVSPSTELAVAAFQVDWVDQRRQAEADLAGPWTEPARAAGCEPVLHTVDDDPARALLKVADEVSATALVIGIHGIGGRTLPLLGGVTRRILHRCTIPVIVVNANPGADDVPTGTTAAPAAAGPRPRHVIAGVGYGDASDLATLWAADYAASRSLPLDLVHAVSDRPLFPVDSPVDTLGSYLGPGVDVEWAEEDLATVREQVLDRWPELVTSARVESGGAVDLLLEASAGAELVVAGKRHGGRLARMTISPRLRQLIVRTSCPTAVIPSTSPVPG